MIEIAVSSYLVLTCERVFPINVVFNVYNDYSTSLIRFFKNEDGKSVAFSGRTFTKGDDRAKYQNSPETDVFINIVLCNPNITVSSSLVI